jgi:hypothetical protein
MLNELIESLSIPTAQDTTAKKQEYDRYTKFYWHKYLIAKLLLPPYIIEKDGHIVLPIESYIHHEAIQSRVGKFGSAETFDTKKLQSELKAFIGALEVASKYPDLTPKEIVNALGVVMM